MVATSNLDGSGFKCRKYEHIMHKHPKKIIFFFGGWCSLSVCSLPCWNIFRSRCVFLLRVRYKGLSPPWWTQLRWHRPWIWSIPSVSGRPRHLGSSSAFWSPLCHHSFLLLGLKRRGLIGEKTLVKKWETLGNPLGCSSSSVHIRVCDLASPSVVLYDVGRSMFEHWYCLLILIGFQQSSLQLLAQTARSQCQRSCLCRNAKCTESANIRSLAKLEFTHMLQGSPPAWVFHRFPPTLQGMENLKGGGFQSKQRGMGRLVQMNWPDSMIHWSGNAFLEMC